MASATAGVAVLLSACGGGSGEERETSGAREGTSTEPAGTVAVETIEEPPPTAKSLVGTWSRIGMAGLIRFTKDGEFRIARNEGALTSAPFAVGTYEVTGQTITLLGGCDSVWRAGLAQGELHVVVVSDEGCDLAAGTELTFVRISRP